MEAPPSQNLPEPAAANAGAHSRLLDRLGGSSPTAWIFAGFAVSYVLFFLRPVFFSGRKMLATQVVPVMEHLGTDLDQTLLATHRFFDFGLTPYTGAMLFPPLTYILFRPLQNLPGLLPYQIMSTLTVAAYGFASVLFPLLMARGRALSPELALVAATGFVSYGLQFELERGQFNAVAASLAYLAIWIFHARPSSRFWAYVLFSLSVQLKLYPLIFGLMLVRDWKDWRGTLRRFGLLGLANFALFFCLGPGVFWDFARAVWSDQAGPEMVGFVNHSIHSFVSLLAVNTAGPVQSSAAPYFGVIAVALYAVVVLCLLLIIVKQARSRSGGFNPDLLLACAIAALLLPGESNDYKLTILAGPVAIFLASLGQRPRPQAGRLAGAGAILLFSAAYSSTLFSFTYKPPFLFLEDLFPALMLMLLAATFVAWHSVRTGPEAAESGTSP